MPTGTAEGHADWQLASPQHDAHGGLLVAAAAVALAAVAVALALAATVAVVT